MDNKSTPRPWKHQEGYANIYALSEGNSGLTIHIAKMNAEQVEGKNIEAEANARLIVKAVNSYEKLYSALNAMVTLFGMDETNMKHKYDRVGDMWFCVKCGLLRRPTTNLKPCDNALASRMLANLEKYNENGK